MNPHKRKRISAKKRKRLASAANPPIVGGMMITTEEEHMSSLGMIEQNEARRRINRTTVVEGV